MENFRLSIAAFFYSDFDEIHTKIVRIVAAACTIQMKRFRYFTISALVSIASNEGGKIIKSKNKQHFSCVMCYIYKWTP